MTHRTAVPMIWGDVLLNCHPCSSHLLQCKNIYSINIYREKWVKHLKTKPMHQTATPMQENTAASVLQVEGVLLSDRAQLSSDAAGYNLGFSWFNHILRRRARMPGTGLNRQVSSAALPAHMLPAWAAVTWHSGASQNRCYWQQQAQSIPAHIPMGTRKQYLSNSFQAISTFYSVI